MLVISHSPTEVHDIEALPLVTADELSNGMGYGIRFARSVSINVIFIECSYVGIYMDQ